MDGDSGKYERLPEGDWPWCPRCWCEIHPKFADVQTIVNLEHQIVQILVHSSCNWYVRER